MTYANPFKIGSVVALVALAAAVPAAVADQCILDDLIVDGSTCIGFDCVCGETFGFDTLRLKENNLRIKFQDTSTVPGFPSNDWQLTANDSASGGANKFSIDDISGGRTPFTVEAGAPSHSLFVDDGGRLGFGTATPSVELHVIDGDTPTLRLQQDGSSGFEPHTWDVAGNETNFFVRDVTSGSQLPFRIRPDAGSNALFIDGDGAVGFGTSAPVTRLHVRGNLSGGGLRLDSTVAGTEDWDLASFAAGFVISEPGSGGAEFEIVDAGGFNFRNGATLLMEITAAGDVNSLTGTFGTISDRDMKENLRPVDSRSVLERVENLPIAEWNYKHQPDAVRHIGPTAQDFHAAFGLYDSATQIALSDLAGVALAAIQGLQQELRSGAREVETLQQHNAALEARLAALEARIATGTQ